MRFIKIIIRLLVLCLVCCYVIAFLLQECRHDAMIYFQNRSSFYSEITGSRCFKYNKPFYLAQFLIRPRSCGEYCVIRGDTVAKVLYDILTQKKYVRKITFPEGISAYEINKKITSCEYLSGDFQPVKDGEVFPDTYHYNRGAKRQTIVDMMKKQMSAVMNGIQNKTNLSKDEIIILASIISREAGSKDEMPNISSVFHNRLRKNMRLQSDVTVMYMASNHTNVIGELTRKDFGIDDPYNTYKKYGLPPEPICCPGRDAILAACNPAKTDYLYFIADINNRVCYFSKTFDEHLKIKNRLDRGLGVG